MADAADTAGSPTESSGDVVYNGLIIPAQMAALLSQGSETRQSPVKRSEHPGAAASSTSNFCATDSAGLAKGSSKSVTTPPQNRPKVIDGVGGDSTGDHDFASPPLCLHFSAPTAFKAHSHLQQLWRAWSLEEKVHQAKT